MGCSNSVTEGVADSLGDNKKVNAQLAKDRKAQGNVNKLLLLGPGESGKSTVFKQMKLLYGVDKQFDPRETARSRDAIHANILLMMTQLITKANEWGIKLVKESQCAVIGAQNEDAQLYPELAGQSPPVKQICLSF
jgi:hypothetical protein